LKIASLSLTEYYSSLPFNSTEHRNKKQLLKLKILTLIKGRQRDMKSREAIILHLFWLGVILKVIMKMKCSKRKINIMLVTMN
jgi:tmRNA-binding protein